MIARGGPAWRLWPYCGPFHPYGLAHGGTLRLYCGGGDGLGDRLVLLQFQNQHSTQ